jgi:hypothetical protein
MAAEITKVQGWGHQHRSPHLLCSRGFLFGGGGGVGSFIEVCFTYQKSSLGIEPLPGMQESLGLIPSTVR